MISNYGWAQINLIRVHLFHHNRVKSNRKLKKYQEQLYKVFGCMFGQLCDQLPRQRAGFAVADRGFIHLNYGNHAFTGAGNEHFVG